MMFGVILKDVVFFKMVIFGCGGIIIFLILFLNFFLICCWSIGEVENLLIRKMMLIFLFFNFLN